MSLESEDRRSLDSCSENSDLVIMKKKICYSREFLLSFGNLDICKKLPSGFDESLKSEFEDCLRITDRPRFSGSLSLQGFRKNDYGSSPPTRPDSGSYSRGTYGKWETRSLGRSDRDSDSQSDRDSDSGRRYTHPSRRSWQSPEHDGLLGSGSFPRPSGDSTGISAPTTRANEHNQLSRTTEPYHPPRPYKALPHSRKDTDAFNDETFGSIDSTSTDRAEEERRRRASFEMMRKEQQRALQEKQKLTSEKHKTGDNELVASASTPISINESEKSSSISQSPVLRPLVPPGFKSNSAEKSFGLKSQIQPPLNEVESVGKAVTGDCLRKAEANIVRNTTGGLDKQQYEEISVVNGQRADKPQQTLLLNQGQHADVYGSFDVPVEKPFVEDQMARLSSHLDSLASHTDSGTFEPNAEILEDKPVLNTSSTSILEKIFGSTPTLDDNQSSLAKNLDSKPDDPWLPSSVQSSKFAQWFFEEETKLADDASSARPNNLFSLIGSSDKANGDSGQACTDKKEEAFPTVLTCEDLEQSILSEYSSNTTEAKSIFDSGSHVVANSEEPSALVDNHASLHLLSILQKSTDQNNSSKNFGVATNLPDNVLVPGEHDMAAADNKPEGHGNSGRTLTLETLFGTAFMKELQSVEAPVSVKRGPMDNALVDASQPPGLPFPIPDNGVSLSSTDKSGLQRLNHDYSMPLSNRQYGRLNETDNWVGVDDFPTGTTLPRNLHTIAVPKHGVTEKSAEFLLPEEDHLISLLDTKGSQMLTGNPINEQHVPSNTHFNIEEKLAALVSIKDHWGMEGSGGLPLARDSYKNMEPQILHQDLHMQQPASSFQPPQITQLNPLYPQLEPHPTHLSSQMHLNPESIYNQSSLPNQPLSSSMIRPPFPHPNVGVSGFDVPPQHSLLHQMQMPGNRPPRVLRDFPRGNPSPHHVNQGTGFIQEVNQMQDFPFGPLQPNIGSHGIPMPGNPPEAFQRLIEMELRANSKQIHPFGPPRPNHTNNQGIYGHEVDMGSQYR